MTTIYFVRHGEVHNPQHILYGRLPRYRLSQRGLEQAAAAAAYLQDHPLAAVISSPRLRARQTAAIIARPHGLPVRLSTLVDEVRNPHQGRATTDLEAEGWRLYTNLPPGYETPEDVLRRVLRLIGRLRAAHPGQEVAVVTHGDIVLAVQFWVAGIPFTDDTKNRAAYPATASITTLTFVDGARLPALSYLRPY